MKTFLKLFPYLTVIMTFVIGSTTHAFVFEAQFTDTVDTPITTTSTIRLRVYDHTNSCLLFEEEFSQDLSITAGKVSLPLGTGTQNFLATGAATVADVFVNKGSFTGQGACPYNPTLNQGRVLRVGFDDDGAGANPEEELGPITINPAPQAGFATEAKFAQNLTLDNAGNTTTFITQATANYTLDFPTGPGASGQLLSTDGTGILSWVTVDTPMTLCSGTDVLLGDGSCSPLPTAPVTSVNGQTGVVTLAWADFSKAGSLLSDIANVDVTGRNTGDILAWNGSNWIVQAQTTDTNTNAATLCAAGEYLDGDGSCQTAASYTAGTGIEATTLLGGTIQLDLEPTSGLIITGNQLDLDDTVIQKRVTGSCTVGQAIRTVAVDGTVTCENLPAPDNLGNHTATTNIQLGTNWLSGDGGNEGVFVNATGDVGIGIAAPTQKLTVSGNINVTTGNDICIDGSGCLSTAVAGSGEINTGANTGVGASVFKDKTTTQLNFRSLASSDSSLTITQNTDDIDLVVNNVGIDKISNGAGLYFTYQPNNVACAEGEVMKWSTANSRWECGADAGAGGSDAASLMGEALDPALATSTTTDGQILVWSQTNSRWEVAAAPTDTNTTYTAGTGLGLTGTTFNVDVGTGPNQIVQLDGSGNLGVGIATPNESITTNGAISLQHVTAPGMTAGFGKLYVDSGDTRLYFIDEAGVSYDLTAGQDGFAFMTSYDASLASDQTVQIPIEGDYYLVSVAGTNDPDGIDRGNSYAFGDRAIYNSQTSSWNVLPSNGSAGPLDSLIDVNAGAPADGDVLQYNVSSWSAGPMVFPDGSDTAPPIRFGADTGTGIFNLGSPMLGFSTAGAERMRITNTGKVGIGTTTPAHALHVVGTAGLSTGTAWTNASDRRLKDIRGDYQHGLNEIMQLNTVRFNYKEGNELGLPSDKEIIGFIAQEVEKVIPEAVIERRDGFLELNVDPIHWALVNATQEQQRLIEENSAQKARLEELEEKNRELEERLERLEEALLNR